MKRGNIAATMEGKVMISISLACLNVEAAAMAMVPLGSAPATMRLAARRLRAPRETDAEYTISTSLSLAAVVTALFVAVAAGPASAAPRYVAVMIDAPPHVNGFAGGINAAGDVAGALVPEYSWFREGGRAFRYVGGILQELQLPTTGDTDAVGISDDGQVAVNTSEGFFLYSGPSTVHPTSQNGSVSTAGGMSGNGNVVGVAWTPGGRRAFRYTNSHMEDLGTLGGIESLGVGINRAGDVTGWLTLSKGGSPRAFIYTGGVVRMLGDLGRPTSFGTAINDVGQVAGTAYVVGGSMHAFLYTNGAMRDLGTLGGRESQGSSINAKGDVTGWSAIAEDSSYRAFLYTNGEMHDLNALVISGLDGFTLFGARGINDQGQVVASGCDARAETCRVFRLDVVTDSPRAIEYHHATFDHYFLTALPDEIAKLDSGILSGWVRTGQSFGVYSETSKATSPVCRFFSTAFGPKSSHFYTADAGECAKVQSNRDWQFEGLVFNVETPDLNGACPPSAQPVYRLYNNGLGAAPNHRFTTSAATRTQMIAAGWISEGAGLSGVAMCSPV